MMGDWWTDQGLQFGPGVALLLFLAVFFGMLFWIFRPGSSRIYEERSNLPFQDDASGPAISAQTPSRESKHG